MKTPWLVAALIAAGAGFCIFFVAREQGLYYWDFAWYENQAVAAAHAFHTSTGDGVYFIARTLGEDYNDLFAIPLIPWILAFGEHRVVYILAVYFTFFVPYLLGVTAIAARIAPDRPGHAAGVAAIATLATPACWYHVLQGYPDVAGAAAMTWCVILYGTRGPDSRLGAWVGIGLLAGLSVMLRRHYVYAVAALYFALLLDGAIDAFTRSASESAASRLRGHVVAAVVSAGVAAGVVVLIDPHFFAKALATQSTMAPWRISIAEATGATVGTVGAVPLVLATIGWLWEWRQGRSRRPGFRVPALATMTWALLWIGHARQAPYHYPHWVPLFVALGLAFFWLRASRVAYALARWPLQGAAAALVATAWLLCVPANAFSHPPPRLFPDQMQRSDSPAYASIVELVRYLRDVSREGEPIIVAASSPTLNFDTLPSAEIAIDGRRGQRLEIVQTAQTNDALRLPTQALFEASFVVVAEPFQHHLEPEYQRIVRVLVDAFHDAWPISRDFELLPRRFPLAEAGSEVRVYRRIRPTSPDAALDTFRRINRFVLGRNDNGPAWMVRSPFPSTVASNADGTFQVQVHPTKLSEPSHTTVELLNPSDEPAATAAAADVWFTDHRCVGIEIVAVSGGEAGAHVSTMGVFTPQRDAALLRAAIPNAVHGSFHFEIRSSPAHPENIDYCTIVLKELTVRRQP